jgi:hypothetical protein
MKKQIALALALAVAPFAASAGELSYNYVEGSYAHLNIDVDGVGDAHFNGGQLRGSFQVIDQVYLFGGYGKVRNDDAGVDVDFDEAQLGVGFRMPVSDSADFIAELGALRQEIEVGGDSQKADGGRASVGVRTQAGESLEGWVKASYTDGGDFEGGFSGTVGALFKFNPTWGVLAEIEYGESDDAGLDVDMTKFLIGVRASF